METYVDAIVADLDEYELLVLRERWGDRRLRSEGLARTIGWKPRRQKAVWRLWAKGVLEAPELDKSFVQPTELGWKVISALSELVKVRQALEGPLWRLPELEWGNEWHKAK